jgi:predicted dehydrogenase
LSGNQSCWKSINTSSRKKCTEAMALRAAVIGCGQIGSTLSDDPRTKGVCSHSEAYSVCEYTELVSVCDRDLERARLCGQKWQVGSSYNDPQEMLSREQPDIISICTPDATHYTMAKLALSSKGLRALFMEKPLAMTLEQCHEIVSEAQEGGVLLAVNYLRRHVPGFIELAQWLGEGGLGSVQSVTGAYTKGIFHNGTHVLDLLRMLLGEVKTVQGFAKSDNSGKDPELDVMLTLESGAHGFIHCCDAEAFRIGELDIIGQKGRALVNLPLQKTFISLPKEDHFYSGYLRLESAWEIDQGVENAILWAVKDIVDCLRTGKTPRCSGVDGVAAFAIAQAAVDSLVDLHPHAVCDYWEAGNKT